MPSIDQSRTTNGLITVEVANTHAAVREAQFLRHQVFCMERNIPSADAFRLYDQDRFDCVAKHIIVRRRSDRCVVATSRVVAGEVARDDCLPMQKYCCPSLFRRLPMDTIGEISRFAISKQLRAGEKMTDTGLRLGLLRGILAESQDMGLTHWCALMKPSLMRLLSATGIQFTPFGPSVDVYGQRIPYIARIERTMTVGRRSHPRFYESVTGQTATLAA